MAARTLRVGLTALAICVGGVGERHESLLQAVSLSLQADSAGQDHRGQVPYDKVCRACHGPRGLGDQAPRLVPMERDVDEVLSIVRDGLGQMPEISRREIADDDVRLIVEYLKSLTRVQSR